MKQKNFVEMFPISKFFQSLYTIHKKFETKDFRNTSDVLLKKPHFKKASFKETIFKNATVEQKKFPFNFC